MATREEIHNVCDTLTQTLSQGPDATQAQLALFLVASFLDDVKSIRESLERLT